MTALRKHIILVFLVINVIVPAIHAQTTTKREKLLNFAGLKSKLYLKQRAEVEKYAASHQIPVRFEKEGVTYEIQYIDKNGRPQYYVTDNAVSAATISTVKVHPGGSAGLNLDGTGITIREWDAGSVRSTHKEFDTRVTNIDASSISGHSTHVAGTLVASGDSANAKGMAFAASLLSFDWNNDVSEMASQAAQGMQVSNHSYSYLRGWNGSTWWGDTTISKTEDYRFGFYDENARDWDQTAYDAPYYLIVKAASNDRDDVGDGTYPPDGPYDCIPQKGVAKNILTVGAVKDIPGGYTQPSDVVMTSFSSWGPADDGRIKPDISANGEGLFSTYSTNDSAYLSLSGTSMATPSVAGSIALLIQHYKNLNGSNAEMRSATIKALVIHTADEAGSDNGPDYEFGWGLMNTDSAAALITRDQTVDVIGEYCLTENQTYIRTVVANGLETLKATIVWTDPPGIPPEPAVDPPDTMLINDLDLKITQGSNTYYPWKLDKDNPSNAATNNGKNYVDNVESVTVSNPVADSVYTITVSHDGTLQNGHQAFSLILWGIKSDSTVQTDFSCNNISPGLYQEVDFFDMTANFPSSWNWEITPHNFNYVNGTNNTSQNPQVEFTATGTYTVSLTSSNQNGSDSETKTGYITVNDKTSGYCYAWSDDPWGYITRVQLDSIDNSTGIDTLFMNNDTLFYGDYTSLSTGLIIDSTYNITVTDAYTEAGIDINIWIDWTRDGDFDDTGEDVVCDIDGGGGTKTFSFTVPSTADRGKTRLRIRTKYYYSDCGNPCNGWYYGEVEDYSVTVYPATNIWTGAAASDSANWNNAGNWINGKIPSQAYNVKIPASPTGGVFPEIAVSDTAYCQKLTIEKGGHITVKGTIIIGGTINGHNKKEAENNALRKQLK